MLEIPVIILSSMIGLCILIAVTGVILIAVVRAFRGGAPRQGGKAGMDEAKVMQELHAGLLRMEQRVESLETLLLDKVDRPSGHSADRGDLR